MIASMVAIIAILSGIMTTTQPHDFQKTTAPISGDRPTETATPVGMKKDLRQDRDLCLHNYRKSSRRRAPLLPMNPSLPDDVLVRRSCKIYHNLRGDMVVSVPCHDGIHEFVDFVDIYRCMMIRFGVSCDRNSGAGGSLSLNLGMFEIRPTLKM